MRSTQTSTYNHEQPWRVLSLFQSTDIIRDRFKEKHDLTLNLQRAREIATCFVQGDHYFDSASGASQIVKPLLLYYGVLSLSRGLILLLEPRKKEEALAQSHGLSTGNWQNSLTTGIDFMELGVTSTKGTFQELADATHNELVLHASGSFGEIDQSKGMQLGARLNGVITLRDLLARMAELAKIYEQCTGISSSVIPCEVNYTVTLNITIPIPPNSSIEDLKTRLRIPETVDVHASIVRDALLMSLPYDGNPFVLNPSFPHLEPPEGAIYLLEPWENGGYLSPILRYFVISYILGMLVRYFPSRWMYLFSYQKGDVLLPILRETVSNIEFLFPKEVARMVQL